MHHTTPMTNTTGTNSRTLDQEVEALMTGLKILGGEEAVPGYQFAWNAETYNPDDLWATLNVIEATARETGAELPEEIPYLTVRSYANIARSTLNSFVEQVQRAKESDMHDAEDEHDLSWTEYLGRNVENALELMHAELTDYLDRTGIDLREAGSDGSGLPASLDDSYEAFKHTFASTQNAESTAENALNAYRAGVRFIDHAQLALDHAYKQVE